MCLYVGAEARVRRNEEATPTFSRPKIYEKSFENSPLMLKFKKKIPKVQIHQVSSHPLLLTTWFLPKILRFSID